MCHADVASFAWFDHRFHWLMSTRHVHSSRLAGRLRACKRNPASCDVVLLEAVKSEADYLVDGSLKSRSLSTTSTPNVAIGTQRLQLSSGTVSMLI